MIVPEGVTVGKLNVVKGNVEIYGTVTEIIFGKGAGTVTTYATRRCQLQLKKAIEPDCPRQVCPNRADGRYRP